MDGNFSTDATIHERIKHLVDVLADSKNTVFAQKLGISEANVRGYIKGVVPKTDVLEKIVRNYDINAHWLLTGEGEMLRDAAEGVHRETEEAEKMLLAAEYSTASVPLVADLLDRITAQAAEIGRLEERIRQFECEKEKAASGRGSASGE